MRAAGGKSPYDVLGVSPEASAAEIKRAYRKLARQCHPDSTGGDKAKETRFKEITAAYDVLGDPDKRARYDAFKKAGGRPEFTPGGFGVDGLDLGDLFAQVFGGAAGTAAAGGAGGGGGFTYQVYSHGNGEADLSDLGELFGGFARPRGRASARSRPPAADTRSELRITIDQAILGTVKEVSTPAGKVAVKVPPGTSSGVKLRLKGKGGPGDDGQRGSHYVTVHIDVPKQLDDEARELLVQLMKKVTR